MIAGQQLLEILQERGVTRDAATPDAKDLKKFVDREVKKQSTDW